MRCDIQATVQALFLRALTVVGVSGWGVTAGVAAWRVWVLLLAAFGVLPSWLGAWDGQWVNVWNGSAVSMHHVWRLLLWVMGVLEEPGRVARHLPLLCFLPDWQLGTR